MVIDRTFSRFNTWVVSSARIYTFSVYTRFIARTIGVGTTTSYHTSYMRISYPSRWAFAYSLVVDSVTFSVCATTATVRCTYGNADAIDARVLDRTI